MALSGLKLTDVESAFDHVTFINFNYDRTLEHYLLTALQLAAGVSPKVAGSIVQSLNVLRPYGGLGPIGSGPDCVLFGGDDYGRDDHFIIAERIRTYTEQRVQEDTLQKMENALSNAKLVLILGFGFHTQNMRLLESRRGRGNATGRVILGTVKGIHRENYDTLESTLYSSVPFSAIKLLDFTCAELLEQLRPSIMSHVGQ